MKSIPKLIVIMGSLLLQTTSYSQTTFQKQILVYFKQGVQRNAPPSQNIVAITSANVTQVLNNYGLNATNVAPSFPDFIEADTVNAEIGEESRQMNRAKIFTISLPDTSFKSSLINSLTNLSEVLYAESNGDLTTNLIPVDGRFGQQWNMRNTIIPGADIHAEAAWDIFTGNPNSIIAIIDNGVDINHNDLNPKILGGDIGFQVLIDGLGRQFSHGSHVAGIAAAVTNNNNNNGVAGVDWQARIHPRNIFDGNGDPDITQSIMDAMNFNQNVWTFNNSWGMLNVDGTPGRYSITVRSAFAQVYRNNRVQCVAMGNHQLTNPGIVAFPAGFNSGIIAVGATDINDNITGFSAQGPHIDVSAPGDAIWSTNFNNNFIDLAGTSMATPHVAGLASLLKGFNTDLANDDVEQIIRLTADDRGAVGFDNAFGTGRINAQRALQSLQAPNQIFHWSATGGTVFGTSTNETRIFLGFPGLPDAAYVVRRSEVRTNVVFPTAMCNIIGVWGRGVGTTGYREEQGRCFGEGICEVVPGTLTNAGATLRTWIYEVWSVNGQYLGFWPRAANNVVFQYTALGTPVPTAISGDNTFCGTNSNTYTIPNLPTGATVQWSASPSGVVTVNSPNSPQTTLTRNTDGDITLTAQITNTCNGNFTLTKQIHIGKPYVAIDISSNGNYSELPGGSTNLSDYNSVCNYQDVNLNMYITGASSANWSKVSSNTTNLYWQQTGNNLAFYFYNVGQTAVFRITASNSCGTTTKDYGFKSIDCSGGGGCDLYAASPNPASESVDILVPNIPPPPCDIVTASQLSQLDITEITIYDQAGVMKKKLKYSAKTKRVHINLNGFKTGIYIFEIGSKTHKERKQIVITK